MISGILRNFGQFALDFVTLNVGNTVFPTIPSTWTYCRPTV